MVSDTHPVVILDNGAHTIKTGLSTAPAPIPRIIYNAAIRSKGDKRLYIGHEFEKCQDYASLNYRLAFEKGYLTDWDVQKAIWDKLFGHEVFSLDLQSTSLLITEPPFNFHSLQEKYDQLAFEEYEFASYLRCPAASIAQYGSLFSPSPPSPNIPHPECCLIIDSGFSYTHVVPLMQGKILWNGVRRIDVGGKLLTNHLSTLVSFRQWNMLDQTHIVNDVKEKCCYVSSSFSGDLERCRLSGKADGITLQYILPDFSRNRRGYVRGQPIPSIPRSKTPTGGSDAMDVDQGQTTERGELTGSVNEETTYEEPAPSDSDQILHMSNERFSVPELIFNPSDIGLPQSGLPQMISQSISTLPSDLQGMFWANIGLIGGNTKFPGFCARLREDLRSLAPVEYEVGVYESDDPIIQTYRSAYTFSNSDDFWTLAVTREEYNEGGSNACRRKFRLFDWDPIKDKKEQVSRTTRKERDRAIVEDSGEESEDETKRSSRRAPLKKREKGGPARPKRDLRSK